MKNLIVILSLLFAVKTFACVDLTGSWSGSCVYGSKQYGDLDSSLEILIKQNNCNQISFDNNPMMGIPDSVGSDFVEDGVQTTSRITVAWKTTEEQQLYFMTVMQSFDMSTGKILDNVNLKGHFGLKDSRLQVYQEGSVDGDFVKINCELRK